MNPNELTFHLSCSDPERVLLFLREYLQDGTSRTLDKPVCCEFHPTDAGTDCVQANVVLVPEPTIVLGLLAGLVLLFLLRRRL